MGKKYPDLPCAHGVSVNEPCSGCEEFMKNLKNNTLNLMEKELQKAIIKNWSVIGDQLTGEVYGHPRFEDGTLVRTSTIQKIITRNTEYTLEQQD